MGVIGGGLTSRKFACRAVVIASNADVDSLRPLRYPRLLMSFHVINWHDHLASLLNLILIVFFRDDVRVQ